jgi:hypothetical protein
MSTDDPRVEEQLILEKLRIAPPPDQALKVLYDEFSVFALDLLLRLPRCQDRTAALRRLLESRDFAAEAFQYRSGGTRG